MKPVPLLFLVISLQQLAFAAMWFGMAWQQLARQASLRWGMASLLIAASAMLVALRGQVSPWLGYVAGNALLLMGLLMLRQGLLRFLRRPPQWHVSLAAIALYLAATTALERLQLVHWVAGLSGVLWGGLLLHLAWLIARDLRAEFGRALSLWCAVPMVLVALLFLPRALLLLVHPMPDAQAVPDAQLGNVAVMMSMCVSMMALNLDLISLVIARSVMRLRHHSEHDALTGLLNRRMIESRLAAEAQRQRRYGGSYAVLSIDIDHFKHINDTLGHPAGDAVLREVAATLRALARQVDSVARAGGEEFWVLLPATDAAGALPLAERMRAAVGTAAGAQRITVSIGVAVADGQDESEETLMQRLDAALYTAKREGRDRVVLAPPPGRRAAAPALSPAPSAPPPTDDATLAATH